MPDALLREIRNFLAAAARSDSESAPHVPAIVAGIDRLGPLREPPPRSMVPVDRNLNWALRLGRGRGHDDLLDAIAGCKERLVWYGIEGAYGDRPEYRRFFDNHAFTTLFGPERHGFESLYNDSEMICGLTIQAPGIHYPSHAHPAVEVYAVLGGTACWRRGGEGWTPRPPGSVILHESGVAHAMKTGDEPTLALFAWIGDIDEGVYMVEED